MVFLSKEQVLDLFKNSFDIIEFNEVQGVYDLDLHSYGPSKIVGSVHIQVRDDMTAKEIHRLTREITITIMQEYGIILTIGIYAANDKGEFGKIKAELGKIIQEHKEILQMHGFYVDEVTNHIFFDLIIDFKSDNPENIKRNMIDKVYLKCNNTIVRLTCQTDKLINNLNRICNDLVQKNKGEYIEFYSKSLGIIGYANKFNDDYYTQYITFSNEEIFNKKIDEMNIDI